MSPWWLTRCTFVAASSRVVPIFVWEKSSWSLSHGSTFSAKTAAAEEIVGLVGVVEAVGVEAVTGAAGEAEEAFGFFLGIREITLQ